MYILYSLYSDQQLCFHQTTHQQLSKYLPVVVCDRMELRYLVPGTCYRAINNWYQEVM